MKVKHSWLHTVTMRCGLVLTIKWWGNAHERDDLSALNWPRVFLKTMWLHIIPYFINQNFWPWFILWGCLYCARSNCRDHCIHHFLSTCRHIAGKQPAECKGRNSPPILDKKISSWDILLNIGSLVIIEKTGKYYDSKKSDQCLWMCVSSGFVRTGKIEIGR